MLKQSLDFGSVNLGSPARSKCPPPPAQSPLAARSQGRVCVRAGLLLRCPGRGAHVQPTVGSIDVDARGAASLTLLRQELPASRRARHLVGWRLQKDLLGLGPHDGLGGH